MRKKLRKLFALTLAVVLLMSTSTVVSAKSYVEKTSLRDGYEEVMAYARRSNIPLEMTYKDFVNGYREQPYPNVDAYIDVYYTLLQPQKDVYSSRSGGSTEWYYNIGTSLPANANPNYSKYNLLTKVKKGDTIYEAKGFYGVTGHTMIVEGVFYDANFDTYYVRVIEAIGAGVVRSALDDTRVDARDVSIHRVTDATTSDINGAVNFCIGELGSSYSLDFAKDHSSSETDWYCSEVVWAGYYNEGIDIETNGWLNEPGITPRDITRSSATHEVYFK